MAPRPCREQRRGAIGPGNDGDGGRIAAAGRGLMNCSPETGFQEGPMKRGWIAATLLAAGLGAALPCLAQTPRKDYIWARSTAGAALTLDGILNEPAWLMADSMVIHYGQDSGIPGSGWFNEAGILPSDPTNTDATNDVGYTVEMRFNLDPIGYNFTTPQRDAVEFNISIYDCDWFWPFQNIFSSNRTWWEGPWGRDAFFHNVRILGNSTVTVSSGAAPALPVDVRIPAADNFAAPTLDGRLTESVWTAAPSFDI